MLVGGALGLFTAGWQTVERIAWAADPNATSVCEINSVHSCSSVFSHWQSSALGVPNSLIAMGVFAFMASAAASALLGSKLSRRYLATAYGLTLFMTVFIVWYLEQTAFDIGSLCLFCTACMVNISLVGVGLTRIVDAEGALGDGPAGQRLHTLVDSWADIALWVGLGFAVAAMLFVGLVL